MKLISFDIESDFGFFRKPETNNTLNLSYNMIHRPAILGILGAIIGLEGYKEKGEFPEYYKKLNHLKVGIAPLDHMQGNYLKTPIKYSNTIGYANKGANFLTEELTLISPKYRVFLLLDMANTEEETLYINIKEQRSEFIPYFGKNEFTAWWDNFVEYEYVEVDVQEPVAGRVATLFIRSQILKNILHKEERSIFDLLGKNSFGELEFIYFERLPIGFDEKLIQYQMEEMIYTNHKLNNLENFSNLYYLKECDRYVQLV